MRAICNFAAVVAVLGSSTLVLAQWRLPTQPLTAPITLNDTTIAGSALASDDPSRIKFVEDISNVISYGALKKVLG